MLISHVCNVRLKTEGLNVSGSLWQKQNPHTDLAFATGCRLAQRDSHPRCLSFLCPQEIDVKAGGGHIMTIGEMVRQWLVKLEWYSTLFPRIPVPIEKDIAAKLKTRPVLYTQPEPEPEHIPDNQLSFGEAEKRGGGNVRDGAARGGRDRDQRGNQNGILRGRIDDSQASRGRSPIPRRSSPDQRARRPSPVYQQSVSRRVRTPPLRRTPPRSSERSTSFERDLARERERQQRMRKSKSRSRSRDRKEKKDRRDHSSNHKKSHKEKDRSKDEGRDRPRDSHKDEGKDRHRDSHKDERSSKHKRSDRDRR